LKQSISRCPGGRDTRIVCGTQNPHFTSGCLQPISILTKYCSMTVPHFVNCCLATFGPQFVVYKGTKLSESSGSLRLVSYSAGVYLATQLCKTLLLVVLPFGDFSGDYSLKREFAKNLVNVVDLLGISIVVHSRSAGGFETLTRLIGIGLGWAAADSFASNALPFIFGARGPEFSWAFLYGAFFSNIGLIRDLTLTTLVFVYGRRRFLNSWVYFQVVVLSLSHILLLPLLDGYSRHCGPETPIAWWILLVELVCVMLGYGYAQILRQTLSTEKK